MDDLKGKIDAWLYPSSGRIQFDVSLIFGNKIGMKNFQELEKKKIILISVLRDSGITNYTPLISKTLSARILTN